MRNTGGIPGCIDNLMRSPPLDPLGRLGRAVTDELLCVSYRAPRYIDWR